MKNITINYIVVFYGGHRRHYGPKSPIDLFAQTHLDFINSLPSDLFDFTFVFNDSGLQQDTDLIESIRTNHPNIKIIERPNENGSYGGWDTAIRQNKNYDFSFLIEDDYIPTTPKFIQFFLSKIKNHDYVASLFRDNHAAISNGLFNHSSIKPTQNSIFNFNYVATELFKCQLYFLTEYENICDITDIAHTEFLDCSKKIIKYTNEDFPLILKPIIKFN